MNRRAFFLSAAPYLLLAALVLLFFGDLLVTGRSFALRDTFANFLPWRIYARQSLAAGEIPWWNPYGAYGKPFVADIEGGFYYPGHVLFLFLPVMLAFKLSWMLHLWIAGASMFALGRAWGLGVAAALIAAVAFMFGSFPIALLESADGLETIVWTPLVLLLLFRLADIWARGADASPRQLGRRSARTVVSLAVVTAIQFLAGHSEFFLFGGIFCAICFLGKCLWEVRGGRIAGVLLAALLAGGLMAALVLPQLGPTLELLPYSDRLQMHNPGLNQGSVSPRHLLAMVFPFLYGHLGLHGKYWADAVEEFTVGTCYFGLIPLLLLPFSLFPLFKRGSRSFPVALLWSLGAAGLMLAMGKFTPLAPFFYKLPFFTHFRMPSKFNYWVWIAGPLLAGFGYQALIGGTISPGERRWRRVAFALMLAAWVMLGLGHNRIMEISENASVLAGHGRLDQARAGGVRADYLLGLLCFGGALGVLALRSFTRIRQSLGDALVIGCVFLNAAFIGRQIHPVLPDEVYTSSPGNHIVAALKSDTWRVHTFAPEFGATMYLYGEPRREIFDWAKAIGTEDCWLPYGIYSTYSGGFKITRNLEILIGLIELPANDRVALSRLVNVRTSIVNNSPGLGSAVLHRMATETISNSLPRAFVVTRWRIVGMDVFPFAQQLLAGNAFDREAAVEFVPGAGGPLPPPPTPDVNGPESAPNAVQVFEPKRNSVHLEASAPCRSLLVLSDTWYPGWKVFVDHKEEPIYRANIWFRGVFLEQGNHEVDFVYRPSFIGVYVTVSLISAACLCLLWFKGPSRPAPLNKVTEAKLP